MIRELLEWDYRAAGAADAFFHAHPAVVPAAVVPLVEDATVFAARLAERYGFPGAGLGPAQLLRDKALLRAVTRAAGVTSPASAAADGPERVRAFMAADPARPSSSRP
ncbi:biotin carboxylase, partial [Streptomyces zhihengii]